jgi:hypothetical protein
MGFGKIFTTTLKVVAALAIIGAVVWIGFAIFGAFASVGTAPLATNKPEPSYQEAEADNKPSTMPASKWNASVAGAVKNHCVVVGMTKDEVERALGKPDRATHHTSAVGDDWTYSKVNMKDCVKYSGETCSEHGVDQQQVFFSAAGHMWYPVYAAPNCNSN